MVFGQLSKKFKKEKEYLFLGATEAEAEALPNSQMPLSEVYKDYNELIPSLQYEKFIVVGRKGAGKPHLPNISAHLQKKSLIYSQSLLDKVNQI